MNRVTKYLNPERAIAVIGSRWFFVATMIFFIVGASWLALSLDAMGGLDEGYHIYIVSVYKDHISPFITSQNPSYDVVGDLTRLPSYLYHYLMSWPLRLISLVVSDAHMQLFALRLINVALFAGGLVAYRRVLRQFGLSKALANLSILFVTLIPLTVQLAGAVSYDNLQFLLSGVTLSIFIRLIKERQVNYFTLAAFIILGLVGPLVKYTFLPLYLPLFVFVAVTFIRRDGRLLFLRIGQATRAAFQKRKLFAVGISILLLLSTGLFVERYGINVVKYHSLSPSCERLMSPERCAKYYVWQRNNDLLAHRDENKIDGDMFVYGGQWIKGMTTTPFYGHRIKDVNSDTLLGPLPIPVRAFQALTVVGAVVTLMGYRLFLRDKVRRYIFLTAVFYAAVLFLDNYHSYLTYHAPVATSGRYLLGALPLFVGFSVYAVYGIFKRHRTAMLGFGIVALLLMLQGGGVFTDIMRGQPSWFWNPQFYTVNSTVKNIINPFIKENDWL